VDKRLIVEADRVVLSAFSRFWCNNLNVIEYPKKLGEINLNINNLKVK